MIGILTFFVLTTTCAYATFWGIPTPGPLEMSCSVLVSPQLAIFFGGQNAQLVAQNDVHFFNLTTNRWTSVVALGTVIPPPRVMPICVAIDSHTVLVYGGYDAFQYQTAIVPFTDMYTFDMTSFTWTPLPPSPGEQGGAAGAYVNGLLVVFGGQPYQYGMSAYAQDLCTDLTMLYNLTSQQWSLLNGTNGPAARCYASMAVIGSQIYMTAGSPTAPSAQKGELMDMWVFDTMTRKWINLGHGGTTPSDRSWGLLVSNGPHLYYAGGTGTSWVDDVFVFDANNSTWSRLPVTMPLPAMQLAGFFAAGKLYYYGGWTTLGVDGSLRTLDIQTLTFQDLSLVDDTLSSQAQRFYYAGTLYQDVWYVFGGASGGSTSTALNDMVAMDLQTFSWSPIVQYGAIPAARYSPVWVTIGSKAILFGGAGANFDPIFNDTYLFDFATRTWSPVATNQPGVPLNVGATAVVWQQCKMVVFGGENCCVNLADVWILDLCQNMSAPTWSLLQTNGPIPLGRWNHMSTIVGDIMYMFGGAPAFNDLWSLDLAQAVWTQLLPNVNPAGPWIRQAAAGVLVFPHWYINGGQNDLGQPLSETWAYDVVDQTWTQIKTLDANTPMPFAVMQHQGVASPFGDPLIIWGPGTAPGGTEFRTQFLSPGYHDITISNAAGSDVLCQLDETHPCQSFTFALQRFAGSSRLEFTVSADLLNRFTIGSSQVVPPMAFSVPLLLQGNGAGIVLDCQQTTCFTLSHIKSNPFSLSNLVLRHACGRYGSVISAIDSLVSLHGVTIEHNRASQQGGAIYLQSSTLSLHNAIFFNNTAQVAGGAVYAFNNSIVVVQSTTFRQNQAHTIGGAISATGSSLSLIETTFSTNRVHFDTVASAAVSFVAGGAVAAIDCDVFVSSSTFQDNEALDSTGLTTAFGGAFGTYTASLTLSGVQFDHNSADNGGAIASLSVEAFAASVLPTVLRPSIVSLWNTSLSSNVARHSGGALYASDAQAVGIVDSSFFNNSAQSFGGGLVALTAAITTIASTTFVQNACWNGNGGALALLSSMANVSLCTFAWNASPMGGGGAVYHGSATTAAAVLAASVAASSLLPIYIDKQTLFAASNQAAFGNVLATDPTSIACTYNTSRLQNAGQMLSPPVVVSIVDLQGQTVVLNGTTVTAYCDPPNAFDINGRVVTSVRGRAIFSGLTSRMQPGNTSRLWFVMGAFETAHLTITLDICHPGSFHNVAAQRCDPCPLRTTTFKAMETVCVPLNRAGDPLTWQAGIVWVVVGLLVFGAFLCVASSRIRRFVDCILGGDSMTGWWSPFRWIWFNLAIGDVVQVIWMTQAVTVSTTIPGAQEALVTGLPWMWTFLVHFPSVIVGHGLGLLALRQGLVAQKKDRKEGKKYELTIFASTGSDTNGTGSGSGGTTTTASADSKEKYVLDQDKRLAQKNTRRLSHLSGRATAWIVASGTCHFFASALNIWLCLYGAIQTSEWKLELPNAALFGYWFVPSVMLLSLLLYFRMRWDPPSHSWRRHIFSLAFSYVWFAIHWSVWLTQPLVYQPLPANSSTSLFSSTASSPLLVMVVILIPIILLPGLQLVVYAGEADLSNANLLLKNRQQEALFQKVTGLLFHSGRQAAMSRDLAFAVTGGVIRPHWLDFFQKQYANAFPIEDFNKPGSNGTVFKDLVAHLERFKEIGPAIFYTPFSEMRRIMSGEDKSKPWEAHLTGDVERLFHSEAAMQQYIPVCAKGHDDESILAARDIYRCQEVLKAGVLSADDAYTLARNVARDWIRVDGKDPLTGMEINISNGQMVDISQRLANKTNITTIFDSVLIELTKLLAQNAKPFSDSKTPALMGRLIHLETTRVSSIASGAAVPPASVSAKHPKLNSNTTGSTVPQSPLLQRAQTSTGPSTYSPLLDPLPGSVPQQPS